LADKFTGDGLDRSAPNEDITAEMASAAQELKNGIGNIMDNTHWLMKILDEVAKIHPFVAGMYISVKAIESHN
jgi:hypothetical protein